MDILCKKKKKNYSEFGQKIENSLCTAGSCLVLHEHSFAVYDFKCRGFSFGCPDDPYFSNEIYKRKHCFYRNHLMY